MQESLKEYKCTILGSCRQYTIRDILDCNSLQEDITYPHYSKEVLQMIKYCKYNHISSEEASGLLRGPLVTRKNIIYTNELKEKIESSDIYIVEISSSKSYEYMNNDTTYYAHHIAIEENRFFAPEHIRNKIHIKQQTPEEIEKDIQEIVSILSPKPIILVSHYSSYNRGKRYELVTLLKDICSRHNILFINPAEELQKFSSDQLFVKEPVLSHYTPFGEQEIKKVYLNYIKLALNK